MTVLRCLAFPVGVVAALTLVVWSSSHTAYAQQGVITPPSVTQTHVDVTVQAPPPDDAQIASASTKSAGAVIVNVAAPIPVGWARSFEGFPNIWSQTPPPMTYGNGDLQGLAGMLHNAALGLAVVALIIAGAKLALSQGAHFGQVLFGIAFSATSIVWWQIGIDMNNALCSAINAPTLSDLINPNLKLPSLDGSAIPTPEQVGQAVLVAVYAVIAFLTMFSLVMRLAFIDVLIAIGPLALICWTADESRSWASMYTRVSVGMLFSQVLIVLGFRVAHIVGGMASAGVLGTMVGIAVLLLVRKLPELLSSGRMNAGPGNAVAFGALFALGRRALGVLI